MRVVAGLSTSGLSELALQPWATHYQMVERTRAGWSEKDVEHEALNETIMYLGTTVIFRAGVRGFGGSPAALTRRVIPERWDGAVRNVVAFGSRPAGQAIAQTRLAWQLSRLGVKNAWQVADDATRLAHRAAGRTSTPQRSARAMPNAPSPLSGTDRYARARRNSAFLRSVPSALTQQCFRASRKAGPPLGSSQRGCSSGSS